MLGIHHVDPNQPAQRHPSPLTNVTMLENVNACLKEENAYLLKSYKDLFNETLDSKDGKAEELEKLKTDLKNKTQELAQMVAEKDRWRMWCFSLMDDPVLYPFSASSPPPDC